MPRYRQRTRTLTFRGRQEAGPCKCPVCNRPAKVLPYGKRDLWSTLICPSCGWYQVPTMNASYSTEFTVVAKEIVEVKGRAAK